MKKKKPMHGHSQHIKLNKVTVRAHQPFGVYARDSSIPIHSSEEVIADETRNSACVAKIPIFAQIT